MRIVILMVMTVSMCSGCAPAGRFQIVTLERAESTIEPAAILLDTVSGETWRTASEHSWSKMKRN